MFETAFYAHYYQQATSTPTIGSHPGEMTLLPVTYQHHDLCSSGQRQRTDCAAEARARGLVPRSADHHVRPGLLLIARRAARLPRPPKLIQ